MIVLEDSTMVGKSSYHLYSFFKQSATFGECSLLGKVFTPVALVTVLVVD